MDEYQKLRPGLIYHLCNRGNNSESLFVEDRNHSYFLSLWQKHTEWVLDTFAYSLNDNHFHLVVQLKDLDWLDKIIAHFKSNLEPSNFVSKQISNCFNAYAKSVNKAYNRTGSLFEERFKRKLIPNDYYFKEVVCYIHNQNESLKAHCQNSFTSYETLISEEETFLKRDLLFEKFGGKEDFMEQHRQNRQFKIGIHTFLDQVGISTG